MKRKLCEWYRGAEYMCTLENYIRSAWKNIRNVQKAMQERGVRIDTDFASYEKMESVLRTKANSALAREWWYRKRILDFVKDCKHCFEDERKDNDGNPIIVCKHCGILKDSPNKVYRRTYNKYMVTGLDEFHTRSEFHRRKNNTITEETPLDDDNQTDAENETCDML